MTTPLNTIHDSIGSVPAAPKLIYRLTDLAGRILLAALFLIFGIFKLGSYTAILEYMSSAGVPAILLPFAIALEILSSLAVILGWKTRVAAALLAGFSLITALIFHNNLADQTQVIMFFKNVSIAGGFLLLVTHGAGPLSVDYHFGQQSVRGG